MIGAGAAWQTLLKKMRLEIDKYTEALTNGNFKDYAEAKEITGKIYSLRWAISQAQEILGDSKPYTTQTADEEEEF